MNKTHSTGKEDTAITMVEKSGRAGGLALSRRQSGSDAAAEELEILFSR
jgi:hypothetical protein